MDNTAGVLSARLAQVWADWVYTEPSITMSSSAGFPS